jgi:hypothetical protein
MTTAEKNQLDRILTALIPELVKQEYIYRDNLYAILQNQNFIQGCNVSSIQASLNRLQQNDPTLCYTYGSLNKRFHICKGLCLTNNDHFRKERNLLYFDCYSGLVYDFNTKTFNMPLDGFLNANSIFTEGVLTVLKYEWIFNYIDSLQTAHAVAFRFSENIYKTMPKGFIEAINYNNENEHLPFEDLLYNYLIMQKYGKKYYKFAKALLERMPSNRLESLIEICPLDKIFQMYCNDALNGIFRSGYDLAELLRSYDPVIIKELKFTFDFNRGLRENYNNFKSLMEEKKNEILSKQLQRLNFINGLQIEGFTVVVPQNQKDKQNEGRMQNNCVGYYYDDSICRGENLIYFLRKSDDIKHSYITCRYNIKSEDTVEYRRKNNNSVRDDKEIEIIKQISNIIKEGLANK